MSSLFLITPVSKAIGDPEHAEAERQLVAKIPRVYERARFGPTF